MFLGVLAVHGIAQFFAWAYAENGGIVARTLWNILATPLIHLAGSLADQYFWTVAFLNSLIWATVVSYVSIRFALKH